jgi:ABC-type uncharacterized transport system substrate-binding protein
MKICIQIVLLSAMMMLAPEPFTYAADKTSEKTEKLFRIGYIEDSPFWAYSEIMNATKNSLEKMGWKNRIEFPKDAHISVGVDVPELEKKLIEKAAELMGRNDLNMIISAGTQATSAVLKANTGKTPIFAIGVSDPVMSKFVLSESDSGIDNFTVRVVPDRFKMMFRIFHDVVKFKKLGLMYPNTESGRQFANVDDAKAVSGELGFQVVEYKMEKEAGTEECLSGINRLLQQGIDAFFQPAIICFDWTKSDVKKLFDTLIDHKIPVFARDGSKYVKSGALMGFSSIDFGPRGDYNANKMIRIFQGESPRSLPMIDTAPPKISFNLRVAEKIGFNPPFDILGASDEIYKQIVLPEDRMVK